MHALVNHPKGDADNDWWQKAQEKHNHVAKKLAPSASARNLEPIANVAPFVTNAVRWIVNERGASPATAAVVVFSELATRS